jgi:hypothetical protein
MYDWEQKNPKPPQKTIDLDEANPRRRRAWRLALRTRGIDKRW